MRTSRVVVIGAGVAGLTATVELAAKGLDVTVLEAASAPGGKMRQVMVGGAPVDSGPTVFTMRWVFEELFAEVGATLADYIKLIPAEILARHGWSAEERMDLFADINQSADAIARFSGPAEGRRYKGFCEAARKQFQALEHSFIRSAEPSIPSLTRIAGLKGLRDMAAGHPFGSLWKALGDHFKDPRLRQLFGRYATYCGSSPYLAPATLMLIAHVEQVGVWLVEGGMHAAARGLEKLATERGATFRYGAKVAEILSENGRVAGVTLASGERIAADQIVFNGDAAALTTGLLGSGPTKAAPPTPLSARSLSAVTWSIRAETSGFPLARHNVFFSRDYAAEFDSILGRGETPAEPTVYVCAQDRDDHNADQSIGPERLLCLINAPPSGDRAAFTPAEIASCEERTFRQLERCGLRIALRPEASVITTPADFERLFPATGGALYGRASHGWMSSFQRPTAKSRLPGLYLAGGSVHPGAGVPMAALSGRMAAARLLGDLASTARSSRTAIAGGTSTR